MGEIKAIPTFYNGTQFRSRLEAKWAAFFDLLEWEWEYEPIDLNGYIPDFIIKFKLAPVLVEVKPSTIKADLIDYSGKIEQSGWDKEAMIVGGCLFEPEFWDVGQAVCFGILAERTGPLFLWGDGLSTKCCGISVAHGEHSYHCRACGKNEGNIAKCDVWHIRDLWREAGNKVQWKG